MKTLFLAIFLALALHDSPEPCAGADEGTDMYYSCQTGEADIDISIQDEADTDSSKGRE